MLMNTPSSTANNNEKAQIIMKKAQIKKTERESIRMYMRCNSHYGFCLLNTILSVFNAILVALGVINLSTSAPNFKLMGFIYHTWRTHKQSDT